MDPGDQHGPYTSIYTSGAFACGLTAAGVADCWGTTADGAAEDHAGPFTELVLGYTRSCGLTTAGAIDCWGADTYGEGSDRPGPYTQIATAAYHTCGLTPSGAAECWGNNLWGQAINQPGPFTQLSAGENHTCGLTPAGAADCWGDPEYGADQPGPFLQIVSALYHNCGLTMSGDADCWGWGEWGDEHRDHAGPFTELSASGQQNCGLTTTGAVDCWGHLDRAIDQPGPYGPPAPPSGPEARVVADPCSATDTALLVTGTSADDYIKLTPKRNGTIQVAVNKVEVAVLSATGSIVIAAGGGNDHVSLSSTIANKPIIFGGAGNDLIETAAGAAVVIGGAGDDRLVTRSSRDIVVGGPGADRISAASGDDIVIAGPSGGDDMTDAEVGAWCAIRREWTSSASYRMRVSRLSGAASGGVNGSHVLRAGVETLDDASVDRLDSAGGSDWFHANRVAPDAAIDKVDRSSSEVLSEL